MSTIHLHQSTPVTPEHLVAGPTDFGPGRTHTLTRRPDGRTDLDAVVVRDGKNLKGRALGFVPGLVGERVLGKELAQTVRAIEARHYGASGAERTADGQPPVER